MSRRRLFAMACIAVLVAVCGPALPAQVREKSAANGARTLEPGSPVRGELRGGEAHDYDVAVRRGEFVHLVVEQQGIDLTVQLVQLGGARVAPPVIDNLSASRGREHVYWIAGDDGTFRVAVQPSRDSAGRGAYTVALVDRRAAVAVDADLVAAQDDLIEARRLRKQGRKASLEAAVTKLEDALARFRSAGDRTGEATTLAAFASVRHEMGDLRGAAEYGERAVSLFHDVSAPFDEGFAILQTGLEYRMLGDPQKALGYYERALTLLRSVGDKEDEGEALGNIGEAYFVLHDLHRALDIDLQALPILRAIGDKEGIGTLFNNLGTVYINLGFPEKALDSYLNALPYIREVGTKNLQSTLFDNIGVLNLKLGHPEKALEYFNQSLPLRRELGNKRGEALSLDNIAAVYQRLGDFQTALDYATRALALIEPVGDRYKTAVILMNLGRTHRSLGDLDRALEHHRRALALFDGVGDPLERTNALHNIAEIERDQGHMADARVHFEQAIDQLEFIRAHAGAADNRSAFVATMTGHYESYIDLLMRMHAAEPAAGHDREALKVSEQARARSLLDLVAESATDIREGVEPALLVRERDINARVTAKMESLAKLVGGTHTDAQRAAVEREISVLTDEDRQLQAEIRERSPRYAALTQPQALDASEIQQRVLEPGTLLLEYALGSEHSYLWAVSPDRVRSYQLPPRDQIETLARRVYESLIARQPQEPVSDAQQRLRTEKADRQFSDAAAALSAMLLGPIADRLAANRLVIVADGALQYVPFAVLPLPDGRARTPLIAAHEIATLPSASVLAVLRRETQARPPAPKSVAVLADPVFDSDDARVKARVPLTAERRADSRDGLRRLLFSRDEAEAILATTPRGSGFRALDFEASRRLATSGELSRYRVVHFATHGLVDSKQPELSGLVLSLVDQAGRPQDGFLRLHDIYNLKLNAELVVLSACQTALGKDVRGEGLVGLTRGFMYAGAPRVVASLWQVDDAATAQLMRAFYRELARDHASPASALRAAQLELMRKPQWQSPYYWGGFVLQGDWR